MEFTKDIKFSNNPTENEETTITYNGFLNSSSDLTIVYGFGENWENTTETKMDKTEDGFVTSIKMPSYSIFNFCFRNSNYAWDNNCNKNYISSIAPCEDEIIETAEPVTESISAYEEISKTVPESICEYEDISETVPESISKYEEISESISESESEIQEPSYELCSLIDSILESITTTPTIEEPTENIESAQPNNISEIENIAEISESPIDLGKEITKVLSEISYTPTELPEYSTLDDIFSSASVEKTPDNIHVQESVDYIVDEIIQNTQNFSGEEVSKQTQGQALIETDDPFIISSKQLSKFYFFRKRVKILLYKLFVKFPRFLFGLED